MGYRVIRTKDGRYSRKSSDVRDFYEAMDMAKEGMERICDLAEEMMDQYGYGERYDRREHEMMDDRHYPYEERRRRDSMGRYI